MNAIRESRLPRSTAGMSAPDGEQVAQVVANLDAWLDTMRMTGPSADRTGYGGPVVHWWQNCLSYTGPGLDWRYEGIIAGYLTLWQRTDQPKWLDKAVVAGDDLLQGQLPTGNYRASSFELNPYSGGTPHEAAASLGLLQLAQVLRQQQDERWETYMVAAERNLRGFLLAQLWDPAVQSVRDDPDVASLVPNKACTLAEALFALATLQGDDEVIEHFALPTLDAVLALQVKASTELTGGPVELTGGPVELTGAIPQSIYDGEIAHQYFPYYIARCVPALLKAYDYAHRQRYLDGAVAAMDFIAHRVDEDGRLPQVVYLRGINRYPQWIAPLGDVLQASELLAPYGFDKDLSALSAVLLAGQLPSGGIVTGRGFGAQIHQTYDERSLPDFRDLIPVTGWADKAFRYLARRAPADVPLPPANTAAVERACKIRGRQAVWTETDTEMKLVAGRRTLYRWRKGEAWADVVEPEVMWK